MRVLALATSGPRGEVALSGPDGEIAVSPLIGGRTRGRDIAPAIAALLEREGLEPTNIDAVAADVGPGSFTGVRVGVTTAKTLAYTLDRPVIGLTSLEILAAVAGLEGPLLALRDAGRGLVYAQRFTSTAGVPVATSEPARLAPDAVRALQDGAVPVGESAPELSEALGLMGPAVSVEADAATLLRLAIPRLGAGEQVPSHRLTPLYLQVSAPEERRQGLRSD